MNIKEFKVKGMTCHHCVLDIKEELKEAGFENSEVEMGSVKVEIKTNEEESKIVAAIEEAGFLIDNNDE